MIQVSVADLANDLHAHAVVELLNAYSLDPMGGGADLSAFVRENLIRELRKRPASHVVLAFDDRQPVGLLIAIEGFSTFACRPLLNIHDLIVARTHRGRGISGRLLNAAEEIARSLGCCKLTLEVLEGNHVAQAAYRARGFDAYQLDPGMGKALFWQKKLS